MISTQILVPGDDRFSSHRFGRGRIGDFVSSGSQGEVYAFHVDGVTAAPLVVKWYKPGYMLGDLDLRDRLTNIIERGSPGSNFLWPLDLVDPRDRAVPGFGYVMDRMEARFKKIPAIFRAGLPMTFRTIATAGYNLVRSFSLLHAAGLCYFDISDGNVCIDPLTGDVAILDCDNVTVNGGASPIDGTRYYMAPEIVRHAANPRKETDLHSLAALLFYFMMRGYPLLGARETGILDVALLDRLLGDEPLFVFDPNDDRNAPVPGHHDIMVRYWSIYPEFLKQLFTEAFTVGLHDPRARVGNTRWQDALLRLRDGIFYCPSCHAELFLDGTAVPVVRCWNCLDSAPLPMRLTFSRNDPPVVINSNTELTAHHTDELARWDLTKKTAAVQRNANDPRMYGLKNLSSRPWRVKLADGSETDVPPDRSVALVPGTTIFFEAAGPRPKSATVTL